MEAQKGYQQPCRATKESRHSISDRLLLLLLLLVTLTVLEPHSLFLDKFLGIRVHFTNYLG